MFFNTNRRTGRELHQAIALAKGQNEAVLVIFANAGRPMTPSEVRSHCLRAGRRWPIVSIRRAITTLTKEHKLRKTDTLKPGPEGAPEHLWERAA
jgi:hypothetical protein